jgi:hypothetical protein
MARARIPFPQGSKAKEIEYVIEQYHKAHPDEDAADVPHLIAEWAFSKRLWVRPPADPVELLRRDISRYLRSEYITDPQGREVRKHHAILVEVTTQSGTKLRSIYKELYNAPPEHMKASFQLRRRAAFRDVHQLELDFRSYLDNNVLGATLPPMDYDFNKDIEETDLPTTYPDEDDVFDLESR